MPTDLRSLLACGRVLIADGAMGTMLFQRGLPRDACPEAWNVLRPEVVRAIIREYVEAGADLVTTNTFGANGMRLGRYGFAGRVAELNVAAVQLAREAGALTILGSIGPTGPRDDELPRDEARDAHAVQARALDSAGVDAMLLETFTDLDDVSAALAAVKSATKLPVFATMSCCLGRNALNTATAGEVAQALVGGGADAVGANCGNGPAELVPVMLEMRIAVEAPLIARPNAGLPRLVAGEHVYDLTPAALAKFAVQFREAGVNIIGGCCGTTPAHTRAIVQQIRE